MNLDKEQIELLLGIVTKRMSEEKAALLDLLLDFPNIEYADFESDFVYVAEKLGSLVTIRQELVKMYRN